MSRVVLLSGSYPETRGNSVTFAAIARNIRSGVLTFTPERRINEKVQNIGKGNAGRETKG